MVKGLIDENNLINIADAIREKTGENSVYYPSEMANKILSIQTGGGGLELTTSLVLTSNVTKTTGNVVLTIVLKADYDTVDTDLHGFLSNATVKLYDSNNTLVNTGVTNDNGVVVFNETITEDTTFYAQFDGTSDYEACISNEITVEYQSGILYQPVLDGTEPTISLSNSPQPFTCQNGQCGGYGQQGYLSDGWDNTVDWELTAIMKSSILDGGVCLYSYQYTGTNPLDGEDYSNGKDIMSWTDGKILRVNKRKTDITYTRNYNNYVKITKIGNTISYYENDTFRGSFVWNNLDKQPRMYIGTNTWGGSNSENHWTNIIVKVLGD